MMQSSADAEAPLVTLVLRVWRAGTPSRSFRYQATHVQTGDVAYFRSLENAAQHMRCLVERANDANTTDRTPLQFPNQEERQDDAP
jgi:hypothetical protein